MEIELEFDDIDDADITYSAVDDGELRPPPKIFNRLPASSVVDIGKERSSARATPCS